MKHPIILLAVLLLLGACQGNQKERTAEKTVHTEVDKQQTEKETAKLKKKPLCNKKLINIPR